MIYVLDYNEKFFLYKWDEKDIMDALRYVFLGSPKNNITRVEIVDGKTGIVLYEEEIKS